jgi:hypothetical protein
METDVLVRLDRSEWQMQTYANGFVGIAIHAKNGRLTWKRLTLSDLPNDDISLDDLKFLNSVNVNFVD